MRRKGETAEQAWRRERAELQRVIDEGRRLHSPAGRMFPHLAHGMAVEIARRSAQPKSLAQIVFPNLPRGDK